MKPILFSVSFLFFIESTALLRGADLSICFYCGLTKQLRGRRLNFVFSLRFMIRPYKVIKFFVQMQASSFLFFSFFGALKGNSARQILTADG